MMRVPHPHEEEEEAEGICFTREPQSGVNETLHLSTRNQIQQPQAPLHFASSTRSPAPLKSQGPQPYRLSIPPDMMENIRSYSARYEAHLRRTANNPIGNFDPWKVVDE